MPREVVNSLYREIESVGCEVLVHLAGRLVESGTYPAIRRAEFNIAIVDGFGIHQHIASGIPEFVTEVLVAFDASDIEAYIASRRRERAECHTQCITTVGINAVGEVFARRFLDRRRKVLLHHAASTFLHQCFEFNTVDQVQGIEDVTFRFRHLLAFLVADQAVDIDFVERDITHKLDAHHDHSGNPKENDVEAGNKDVARVEVLKCFGFLGPAKRTEWP